MDNTSDLETGSSTKKPKVGRFRGTAGRLRQGRENHLSHRASLDWRLNRECVCLANAKAKAGATLESLCAELKQSRTGAVLLDAAEKRGLEISYDAQTPQSQFYPRGAAGAIVLSPAHPRGGLLGMLCRELRRAWQYYQGALVNPMGFEPDEAVLVNRAQQADAFMIAVKVAWELKLAGLPETWDYMSGSPVAAVTRAFETQAQEDFRSLNNGEASRAAYDRFFDGSCTKAHDKRIIHQMLLDDAGYMKALKKDGRADMEMFRKLGELPNGNNYLALRGKRLPTDLCYATVEDRSNANFLWFIKFERSFQEKEMQMLKESVRVSAEIVDLSAWTARHHVQRP
ncbi:MAG: hypothetical protein KGL10_01550 [Alphaproteobacteria bacterium]|nr:hypothetical protein [Alphaproteobacteria bacterium]